MDRLPLFGQSYGKIFIIMVMVMVILILDLEWIGSSLGFEGELIWAGLDWRSPDISYGLVNRHLIIIEGHAWS